MERGTIFYADIVLVTNGETANLVDVKMDLGYIGRRSPPEIKGTGHVVRSLEAALWAFYHGDSFREGCLLAVNLGDDADTTGAVYGQLAGAFYGELGIPQTWRSKLAHRELIESFAGQLLSLSESI